MIRITIRILMFIIRRSSCIEMYEKEDALLQLKYDHALWIIAGSWN